MGFTNLALTTIVWFATPSMGNYTCPNALPEFKCSIPPKPSPASDVRKLHPGNIGVVMALGDSITAGFAAKDLPVEVQNPIQLFLSLFILSKST